MKYKRWKRVCILLGACLMLAACGQQANSHETTTSEPELYENELPGLNATVPPASQAEMDWDDRKISAAGPIKDAFLYVTDNESLDYGEPTGTIAHTYQQLACDGSFYILDTCYLQGNVCFYFQQIDGETETGERISLSPGTWGIDNAFIQGMDVLDTGQCVFWVCGRDTEGGGDWRYYMIYADDQGQMLQSVELTGTLKEYGIWEELEYGGVPIGIDGQGNVFIDDVDQHTVYLLDCGGKLVGSHVYPSENGVGIQGSFRTSGGERIIVCGTPGDWKWIQMDVETGEINQLQLEGIKNVEKWYFMAGNTLYYAADHQLVGWNTATGERRLLAKLDDISNYVDTLDMAVMSAEDGVKLLVTEKDSAQRYIMTLSEMQHSAGGEIIVANLYGENSFFSERVISFGRDNPSFGIQYQAAYQEAEADRILMEMANGAGPDVLYLSGQDMKALQAIGAIGELGALISQDTRNVLLPGAIQAGTCEGKLYAIPLSVYVRTLLTSKVYWQEEDWTTDEIFSVLEDHSEIEGLFLDMTGQDDFFYNMHFMVGMDIAHSSFLKDGNSGFDCRKFRDILRTVKEMTQKAENNSSFQDRTAPLVSGKYLGVECMIWDMKIFSETCEKMGDNANFAGYPSDMGSSHYLTDNGMLVVNHNAMEKEAVRELVNNLLSLESQQMLSRAISVRMDIPEALLEYNASGKSYFWKSPNNTGYQLPAKADGSSYLKEYLELLQKAEPAAFDSEDIFNIVMEEADSYFHSDKDLDVVIDIIQKRVQPYLDERK